ncbi:MAG: hypothetical protein BWY11_01938 [Firmicutes bacterium ADurb.Bin182]|nr:MAG: hypothetical protein BWY11_01938 [Firmicutes bacterium ADurb.Bin182]
MTKKIYVFIGNYGSGKTELSLNIAMQSAGVCKTVLVDLDIINPYFRSSERRDMLEGMGVKLISPNFAMTNVDVPSLPPEVHSVFTGAYETVVFDVGGDAAGAVALGQYKRYFDNVPKTNLEVLFVINPRRPLSETPEMALDLLENIKSKSRLDITGLVNNSNLSMETSADDLLDGFEMVKSVSNKTMIPVSYTAGRQDVLNEFLKIAEEKGLDRNYIGKPFPIRTYMHRDWDSFLAHGI